jgi:membrane protein implicated in regulation of membrane protease activity
MDGLVASVVAIAILLGVLLVLVFDIFCLLRLWAADTAHFLPKFAWAVLVVCASPLGGLAYLLSRRLAKRSSEPPNMRARPLLGGKAWFGPAAGRHGRSPASPEGHAVGVVAIAATAYLVLAGQLLAVAAVAAALVIIVFLKATSPDSGTVTLYARNQPRPGEISDPARRAISRH